MKTLSLSLLATLALTSTLSAAPPPTAPAAEQNPAQQKNPPPAIAVKPKPYPLDVCIVSDNDLGSMGEETSIVYEGQVVKFCCMPCEQKFLKNPPRYLVKLVPAAPAKK